MNFLQKNCNFSTFVYLYKQNHSWFRIIAYRFLFLYNWYKKKVRKLSESYPSYSEKIAFHDATVLQRIKQKTNINIAVVENISLEARKKVQVSIFPFVGNAFNFSSLRVSPNNPLFSPTLQQIWAFRLSLLSRIKKILFPLPTSKLMWPKAEFSLPHR